MSIDICCDGYITVAHETLSRSDINTGLTQIRAVCMTQTVRNEIIRKRKRRHESIPIYLASHRDIHIAPQMSTQTIIRRFRVLIAASVYAYRLEGFCLLNDLIEILRDGNISVRVFCFGTANVQQAFIMIDISADKVDGFLRTTSAFQYYEEKKICRILLINLQKMSSLVLGNTPALSLSILGQPQFLCGVVLNKFIVNRSLKKKRDLLPKLLTMRE